MRLVISAAIRHLIEAALDEDDVVFCATSAAFFDGVQTTARFLAKQDLVLAGVDVARAVFASIGADVEWEMSATDGDAIPKGTQFGTVRGDAGMLLRGERTALNFLQRMSGVATLTRSYADALGERVRITDTRKTLPGWRALDKYAVRAGGGANHRYSLSGGVMIKDNHIAAAGGLQPAIEAVKKTAPHTLRIEVEVSTTEMARHAVEVGADIVMLDNMSTPAMQEAIAVIRDLAGRRVLIEASGNITLERLAELGELDLDFVSSGALTHSAPAADISMKIDAR